MAWELTSEEGEEPRNRWARPPVTLALLVALALAFGFVPALEDRTPRRGSFALPPASKSEAPPRGERKREHRASALAAPAVEEKAPAVAAPAVEQKAPAAAQEPQAVPQINASADPAPPPPPADPGLTPELPAVPQLVEDLNVLVSGLPAPADLVGE